MTKRYITNILSFFNYRSHSLLFMVILFTGTFSSLMVLPHCGSGSTISLLPSDNHEIILELTVDDFHSEMLQYEGNTYHRIIIPDTSQGGTPGEPQLPLCGTMIGLPSLNNLSLDILDAQYETLQGYNLYPSPKFKIEGENRDTFPSGKIKQTFFKNQHIYARNAFFPDTPVKIGDRGYLRDQPVAQIQFFPVLFNPVTGEVRIYHKIIARVSFKDSFISPAKKPSVVSPFFENLLKKNIINYRHLKRPVISELPAQQAIQRKSKRSTTEISPKLKITVKEEGMYKLGYHDLTDAGFDVSSIDPRTISMTNKGNDIAIFIEGEDDGEFNTTDSIIFFGEEYTDVYTDENVYWLTTGVLEGLRMNTIDGSLSGNATVPAYFPATIHAEENTFYWQTMPDGEGQDHYFWESRLTAPKSTDLSLNIKNILSGSGAAAVRVQLKGYTDDSNDDPDHHTKIYINGIETDDQYWNGQIFFTHEVTVSHDYLNNGTNTITIESVGDTAASVDQLLVNWAEIDYFDTYTAENDELLFKVPSEGNYQFEISSFTGSNIEAFDITDHNNVNHINNLNIINNNKSYTLQFEGTAQSETRYLALTSARYKSPFAIEKDEPSAWKSSDNGADYIIITHEDFYDTALLLADHRSNEGLRVVTVKTDDIYDEFNNGIFTPQAIQDFLKYAYDNWQEPAPAYVVLVGDAYQDYKDNLASGTINYVPSQIIETDDLGETPSDNWFVLVSGDDILPDMYIGRLCAQTNEQAEDIINKIIDYDQNPSEEDWMKNALLVADDDESSFENLSEEIIELLPDDYTAKRVYIDNYTQEEDPSVDITQHINDGCFMVNYTGHGAVDIWGINENTSIYTTDDIALLDNLHRLPVVTVANCLNGFFTGKNTQVSVAEEFQRLQDKGAIAVWAATALGYTSGHRLLMLSFYESVFADSPYGLGEITTEAKLDAYSRSSYWGELVETFVLFGDPATQLYVAADDEEPAITPTVTPQPESSPTPASTPIVTPTPLSQECTITSMEVKPKKLVLEKGGNGEVLITIACETGGSAEGFEITATIKKGKKKIEIETPTVATDVSGQASFVITAKKKGKAVVKFKADNIVKKLKVKVN
ncbi:MAG: hypothetical protein E3K37_07830 [Candidatus Kuenenia sp.]|nr:hypothetical protein [Candidatus Kuenenia hertensis]